MGTMAYMSPEQKISSTNVDQTTDIYATAFGQDPEFYTFSRSLRAYGNAFGNSSDVMVLNPESSFFDYFGSGNKVEEQ